MQKESPVNQPAVQEPRKPPLDETIAEASLRASPPPHGFQPPDDYRVRTDKDDPSKTSKPAPDR